MKKKYFIFFLAYPKEAGVSSSWQLFIKDSKTFPHDKCMILALRSFQLAKPINQQI
jgi:hypothetical protein